MKSKEKEQISNKYNFNVHDQKVKKPEEEINQNSNQYIFIKYLNILILLYIHTYIHNIITIYINKCIY